MLQNSNFRYRVRVPTFNAPFLSKLREYRQRYIIYCQDADSLDYIFAADNMGVTSTTVTKLAPKLPYSVI